MTNPLIVIGSTPTPDPTPNPNPTPNPDPTPIPSYEKSLTVKDGALTATIISDDWTSGYCRNITILNSGSESLSWTLGFDLNTSIRNTWEGDFTKSGTRFTVTPKSWNANIAGGKSITLGFCVDGTVRDSAWTITKKTAPTPTPNPNPNPDPVPPTPTPDPTPNPNPTPIPSVGTFKAPLEVRSNLIYDSEGKQVTIFGVNWFGMEQDLAPHGLWARNINEMIDQMKGAGFNAVRLPFCPKSLSHSAVSTVNYSLNPELKNLDALAMLDYTVSALAKK